MTCDESEENLVIVYKGTNKKVPFKEFEYFIDHPDEARRKLIVLCKNCLKKSHEDEYLFKKRNR